MAGHSGTIRTAPHGPSLSENIVGQQLRAVWCGPSI